jgi:hypothetical protein
MSEHKEAEQSARRAGVRTSVDKIRRALTEIDINVSALSTAEELQAAKESCSIIDTEIANLNELVKALG